jgi:hypothetical protein
MSKLIRVVHKKPGMVNPAQDIKIEHSLASLQKLVCPRGEGGLIERCYAPAFAAQGVEVFANEEGLFDRDCTPNIEVGGQMLRGPVFFIAANDETGEFVSLTDAQVAFVTAKLRTVVQSIF